MNGGKRLAGNLVVITGLLMPVFGAATAASADRSFCLPSIGPRSSGFGWRHPSWYASRFEYRPHFRRPLAIGWIPYDVITWVASPLPPPPVQQPRVVAEAPKPHRTVIIDGFVYHEYDGVYYKGGPADYAMVSLGQASPVPTTAIAVAGSVPSAAAPNTTVVNVPNQNGSYTPVTLQAGGHGVYIGPQGEVYPTLPTAEQLRAMYGK